MCQSFPPPLPLFSWCLYETSIAPLELGLFNASRTVLIPLEWEDFANSFDTNCGPLWLVNCSGHPQCAKIKRNPWICPGSCCTHHWCYFRPFWVVVLYSQHSSQPHFVLGMGPQMSQERHCYIYISIGISSKAMARSWCRLALWVCWLWRQSCTVCSKALSIPSHHLLCSCRCLPPDHTSVGVM